MTADDIIQSLGGLSAVANQLGVPVTTVSSWKQRDNIPEWRQAKVLELAMAQGVKLATTDFPPQKARAA
jgi:uncharacterized protein YjcR